MDDCSDDELPLILDEEGAEAVDEEPTLRPAVRARPFEEPGALGQSTARRARPIDEVTPASRTRRARR
ncbi:MAG: hypothetical protein QM820_41390 [Minicystis sp.]